MGTKHGEGKEPGRRHEERGQGSEERGRRREEQEQVDGKKGE